MCLKTCFTLLISISTSAGHALAEESIRPNSLSQPLPQNIYQEASDIVIEALQMIGVQYRFGGNTPDTGLDCSGFVQYVFQHTIGMALPRRAEEISHLGKHVKINELHPGDLVFFNTMRRAFSHVGIYIGNNRFIHAPSTGHTIRIDDLANRYWKRRYTGARRLRLS